MKPLTKTSFCIEGTIGSPNGLVIDGAEIDLLDSLNVKQFSPTGFNWGYHGAGPAQASLASCLHIFGDARVAQALYQSFKEVFVASWPMGHAFQRNIDLTDFLIDHRVLLISATQVNETWKDVNGGVLGGRAAKPAVKAAEPLFRVGNVVEVKQPVPGYPAGIQGLVYEVCAGDGVRIIARDGTNMGSFALREQASVLKLCYHIEPFSHTSQSVFQLVNDWQQGVFSGFTGLQYTAMTKQGPITTLYPDPFADESTAG